MNIVEDKEGGSKGKELAEYAVVDRGREGKGRDNDDGWKECSEKDDITN